MTAIDPATGLRESEFFGSIPYRGYNVDYIASLLQNFVKVCGKMDVKTLI